MNWYKLAQLIPIYRGEYSGNKNGNFYSFNKEFAKQFTWEKTAENLEKLLI